MNQITMRLSLFCTLAWSVSVAPAWAFDSPEKAISPEWFDRVVEGRFSSPDESYEVIVKGRRSYSEERAHGDARMRLEEAVDQWLAPDVPMDWTPSTQQLDSLIVERHVQQVDLDPEALGVDPSLSAPEVLYVAGYAINLSPDRRAEFIHTYERQLGDQRMTLAGGALAFVLSILAIIVGYIRVDEATRGYYTTRLRLLAGVAAGAAAVAAYRLLA
jgi:hypothetical protein